MGEASVAPGSSAVDAPTPQQSAAAPGEEAGLAVRMVRGVSGAVALAMSLYHVYAVLSGLAGSQLHRILHLAFALPLMVLMCTERLLKSRKPEEPAWTATARLAWLGVVLASLGASLGYLILNYDYVQQGRFPYVTPLTTWEAVLGIAFLLAVLEVTRLSVGWVLPALGLLSLVYVFAGPFLPGLLHHRGYTLNLLLDIEYMTTGGVFGTPVGVAATYIITFMIFGAFLEKFGFARLLLNASLLLAGGSKGGPAKVAVVGSALMGMLSGSATANVVSTGSFTIPLMKRLGYKPEFAAGVEAAASSGGQLMPPIMGIVAFLMAEFTGIPYIEIVKYALFPAILYFLGIGFIVHLEAHRLDLPAGGVEDRERLRAEVRARLHLLLPVAVLLVLLVKRYTPTFAVIWSIASLIVVANLSPVTRAGIRGVYEALVDAARNTAMVAGACATAGMIIGVVGLTDIGGRFARLVVAAAGDHLLLTLLLTMAATLVLGMGLPVAPAYVLQVAFTVPALISLGVPVPVAHMFVVYYASISMITPPVGLASYVAAAIAGADVLRSSLTATKLGLVAYIVPVMFVYSPSLLLMGSAGEVVLSVMSATVGVFALAVALQGWFLTSAAWWERLLALAAALTLIPSGWATDLLGLAALSLVFATQLYRRNRRGEAMTHAVR